MVNKSFMKRLGMKSAVAAVVAASMMNMVTPALAAEEMNTEYAECVAEEVNDVYEAPADEVVMEVFAEAPAVEEAVFAEEADETPVEDATVFAEEADEAPVVDAAEEVAVTEDYMTENQAQEEAAYEYDQTESSYQKRPMAETVENVVKTYDKDGNVVLTKVEDLGEIVVVERGLKFRKETNEKTGETYLVADTVQIIDPSLPISAYELKGTASWYNGGMKFVNRVTQVKMEKEADKKDPKDGEITPAADQDDADWEVVVTIPNDPDCSPIFYQIDKAKEWGDLNIGEYDINESYGSMARIKVSGEHFKTFEEAAKYLEKRKHEMEMLSGGKVGTYENGFINYESGSIYDQVTVDEGPWAELYVRGEMPSFTLDQMDTHAREELAKMDKMVAENLKVDASDIKAFSSIDDETGVKTRVYRYTLSGKEYMLTYVNKVHYENGKCISKYAPEKLQIKYDWDPEHKYGVYEYPLFKTYQAVRSSHADASPEMYDYYRTGGHTFTAKDGSTVFLYNDPNGKGLIDDNRNFYELSVNSSNPEKCKAVSKDGSVYYAEIF